MPALRPLVMPARGAHRAAELLTAADLADELRISLRNVWRCIQVGRLPPPSVRLSGKLVRWRRCDVEASLAAEAATAPGTMPGTSAEADDARSLTSDDVADLLGATRKTVYRLIRRGALPPPNRQGQRLHWQAPALAAHLSMPANSAGKPSAAPA